MNLPTTGRRGSGSIRDAAVVLLAAAVPYLPALNSWFVGDDFDFLRVAAGIEGVGDALGHTFWGEYMPVFTLSFLFDRALWELNAIGFHLTSLAFHALASLAVAGLVRTLTGERWLGLLCAVLFAIHPIHDEAVIYIAARGHLIGGWLTLVALYCHARLRQTGNLLLWIPGLTAFLVGLLAKETTILVPGFALAADLLVLQATPGGASRSVRLRRALFGIAPFLAGATAYLGLRVWIEVSDDKFGKAVQAGWDWGRLPAYFMMEFLPVPGTLLDRHWLERLAPAAAAILAALVLWAAARALRPTSAAAKFHRGLPLYALVFFGLGTLPFLLDALSLRRRYGYLGSFGASLFVAIGLWTLVCAGGRRRIVGWLLVVAVVGTGTWAVVERSMLYGTAGRIARNVVEDIVSSVEPDTERLRIRLLQLPYRVGGGSPVGAYLFHSTDLRSAVRFFCKVPRVDLETVLELDHAEDHTARTRVRDRAVWIVELTSKSRRVHRALLAQVTEAIEDEPDVLALVDRDDDARSLTLKLTDPEFLHATGPPHLLLRFSDGHVAPP